MPTKYISDDHYNMLCVVFWDERKASAKFTL